MQTMHGETQIHSEFSTSYDIKRAHNYLVMLCSGSHFGIKKNNEHELSKDIIHKDIGEVIAGI